MPVVPVLNANPVAGPKLGAPPVILPPGGPVSFGPTPSGAGGTITPKPIPPPGGILPTPVGDVPIEGEAPGGSWSDLVTYSSGSPVVDAAAGGLAGWLVSPGAGARPVYAAVGALATGLFGAVGALAVVGAALVLGRGGKGGAR